MTQRRALHQFPAIVKPKAIGRAEGERFLHMRHDVGCIDDLLNGMSADFDAPMSGSVTDDGDVKYGRAGASLQDLDQGRASGGSTKKRAETSRAAGVLVGENAQDAAGAEQR